MLPCRTAISSLNSYSSYNNTALWSRRLWGFAEKFEAVLGADNEVEGESPRILYEFQVESGETSANQRQCRAGNCTSCCCHQATLEVCRLAFMLAYFFLKVSLWLLLWKRISSCWGHFILSTFCAAFIAKPTSVGVRDAAQARVQSALNEEPHGIELWEWKGALADVLLQFMASHWSILKPFQIHRWCTWIRQF